MFIAPEQIRGGSATPATDVFGLGHLAVFAAAGRAAFGEGDRDSLLFRITHESPDLDDCPDEIRAIAGRCLAKDPDERPGLTRSGDYARQHTSGQTLHLAEPWLPTAIADSLASYDATAYRLGGTKPMDADPGPGFAEPDPRPETMASSSAVGRPDPIDSARPRPTPWDVANGRESSRRWRRSLPWSWRRCSSPA